MDKLKTWWRLHRPSKRKIIQLYAALLYNAHLRGLIDGTLFQGITKSLCVPGMNCYSCPGAVGACPLGALQNALASSGHRLPYYMLGLLALFGLILGRTICGWLCPLGWIQELLHKLPTPKIPKGRLTRILSYFKYILLAVFVGFIPLYNGLKGLPLPGFCKYICPAGTLEGAVALLLHPNNASGFPLLDGLFTRKLVIAALLFGLCVFLYRAFCRFLCPLGAIYGFFCRLALVGVQVDGDRCTGCGLCVARCKMDVKHVGDHECIHCGECVAACPAKAITFRAGRAVLMGHDLPKVSPPATKKRRWPLILCAGGLLGGMLIYANFTNQGKAVFARQSAPVTEITETADTTPSTHTAESTETAETAETVQTNETAEKTEATERAERAETVEATTATGKTESTERTETVETTTATGKTESTERAETAEATTAAGKTESTETAEAVETTESTDSTSSGATTPAETLPQGHEVGQRLPDFTLPYIGREGAFTLSEYRGQPVVLNIWATWCAGCVAELPDFDRFATDYAGRVTVLAIHSNFITDSPEAFVEKQGLSLSFAVDTKGDVMALLGATPTLPQTLVLDSRGKVIYNQSGSMNYDKLVALVAPYLTQSNP